METLQDQRFWNQASIVDDDSCWLWTGRLDRDGYGITSGRRRSAHRWAYQLTRGPIPKGMQINHSCHTRDVSCPGGACPHRRCVNPAHLEVVTNADNIRRSRMAITNSLHPDRPKSTHCPSGHELVDSNTVLGRKRGRVYRRCLTCKRASSAKSAAKKRGDSAVRVYHARVVDGVMFPLSDGLREALMRAGWMPPPST